MTSDYFLIKTVKVKKYFPFILILLLSCSSETPKGVIQEPISEKINPAAPDFDLENSDAKAIEIADAVMESMGGRKAWDDLKVVGWDFFGARHLWWNKHTGDVRIDFPESDSNILIVNLFTHQGKIKIDGEEVLGPDSLVKHYTEMAESMWINDAYWLFMPFKLKDSKTTLKYLNIDTAQGGVYSHKLQLTFNEIGDTPNNKYWVYVDTTSMLVSQWSYFSNASDSLPRMTTPWHDYQKYGELLLSGERGKRNITDITVMDSIAESVFLEF
ncbi:MAG: hypothetical protein COA97_07910 [Flavobacteriales bacterium]|nr:MAG: hypothetical protein COA97_07910 [Flavobacteriales bacterium]